MTNIKKIRIGNDIRLAVDIRQYTNIKDFLRESEVYNPENSEFEDADNNIYVDKNGEVYHNDKSEFNSGSLPYVNKKSDVYYNQDASNKVAEGIINIKSIKAIIINTSEEAKLIEEIDKKSRFIARFPIEPDCRAFDSTDYNICCAGFPTYRAYPRRYYTIPYGGFGIYPEFGGLCKKIKRNPVEYVAPVIATESPNVVEVMFPADQQLSTGVYKLVLVIRLYVPGYGSCNIRTVTNDYPDVFQLVGSSKDAVDEDVVINVNVKNYVESTETQ